ncbi:dnaJ homolog subfamily C member 17 isoform X4 [Panthera uncia]|uniref:dnaJ homolog subfamily C member 17 isoform X4 n=1 Tax=Panthera uncia TaxID=29064 RepID=UPI0020FFF377|nr:dnaJ homolog subfamily C member 17 isoform X4 [Panthera uncia]
MAVTKELLQMDLYALLGIEEKAADKEVKKAYRQKALSCHPDKNPDNPRAAELFHQLSQALEVLTDAAARAAYDKVRKAKKQAAERTQKLDERRKKVKLDLEARERQAQAHGSEEEEESRNTRTLEQEVSLRACWPKAICRRRRRVSLGGCPGCLLLWIWVICPTRRLLSPSLQVEPPRDLHKVSQTGIGSAQNCHSPQPRSADRTPSRRGFPAAGGTTEADPGADTPGTGAEVESTERCSTWCFPARRLAPLWWSLRPSRLRSWLSKTKWA